MGIGLSESDRTAYNLKRGAAVAKILITHIDRMIEVYRADCEKSASHIRQRQFRVIYEMYIAEERKNTREIAEEEGEELRTIQNDAKAAREDLTALFFGINGLLVGILRD